MDVLIDFGPEISQWLQENWPQLEPIMAAFTQLGSFNFYLLTIPFIYWSIHKQLGGHLLFLLTLGNTVGETLKHYFRDPRPYWYDPSLNATGEPTYGFPSNHSLVPPLLFFVIASWVRKTWVWVVAIILALIVMFSRIYLGVHDVPDVLFGFLLGMIIFGLYISWRRSYLKRFNNRILGQKLLAVVLIGLFFFILTVVIVLVLGEVVNDNPEWDLFYEESERASLDGATANIASLLGFGIGLLFEGTRIRFDSGGTAVKRILRYLFGIITTTIIFFGLRSVFPDTNEADYIISIPLRAVRYFISAIWVAYYAPALFVRLNLAERLPESNGITLEGTL
ncbi:MAG: phosphatase PAP2 family protein [Phycisphaerae bacterium]|nr:phosphatase PAP2 family protein [Phycisphaerae bacterium]NIW49423.1 phosphatase PAP2 family protein [Gammaproteobacteria bacterium]NIX30117.1 phosphatase PAP2 family protein [Phycisphaerae bacterium]